MGALKPRLPELGIALLALAAALALGAGPSAAILVGLAVALFGELAHRSIKPEPVAFPSFPLRSDRLYPLSRAETRVARLVVLNLTNKEIADRLFLTEKTVDNHVQHCFQKLDFHKKGELMLWVLEREPLEQTSTSPGAN